MLKRGIQFMRVTQAQWLRRYSSGAIAVFGIMAFSTSAIAHGANITIQAVRTYEIKAVYDSGEPMIGAQVRVFHEENPQTAIETGTTDDQGRWIWVAQQPGNWTFQVRQAGHGGIAELEIQPQPNAINHLHQTGAPTNPSADHDGFGETESPSQMFAARQTSGASADALPRWIAIGSMVWGAIGTALFFSRRSSSSPPLSRT